MEIVLRFNNNTILLKYQDTLIPVGLVATGDDAHLAPYGAIIASVAIPTLKVSRSKKTIY